jgi:predicted transcriptional regulator
VPDDVFRKAEKLAKRLGVSRSELYANALRDYISRRDSAALTKQLNEAVKGLDTRLDPQLAQYTARKLRDEQW